LWQSLLSISHLHHDDAVEDEDHEIFFSHPSRILQASTTSPSSAAALVLSEQQQQQIACVTRASVPSPFP
jgi:hypothetical protein